MTQLISNTIKILPLFFFLVFIIATTVTQRRVVKSKKKSSQVRPKQKKEKKKPKIKEKVKKFAPKVGRVNIEDFKCIFCFKLPELPADKGRAIVLCPICKHPAHLDEFRDWLKRSKRCSRCDAPIPLAFRRKTTVIPIKFYVKVIKIYKKTYFSKR